MKIFAQGAPGATLTATVYAEDGTKALQPTVMVEDSPGMFAVDVETEPGAYYVLSVHADAMTYPVNYFYGEGEPQPEVVLSEPEPEIEAPKGVKFSGARRF